MESDDSGGGGGSPVSDGELIRSPYNCAIGDWSIGSTLAERASNQRRSLGTLTLGLPHPAIDSESETRPISILRARTQRGVLDHRAHVPSTT